MTRVRLRPLFAIVAIVAVALNLRPALAAIGPLLDMIQAATGATNTQASLLTTLPVFVMGICALAGGRLNKYLNERTGIALGVAMVALACAARYVGTQTYGLLLTAVLAGVGIALVQTLLPAFIKRNFAHDMGRVFGLYTTGIMAGAAVAAASAAGLAGSVGWPAVLAFWSVPALLALPLWLNAAQDRADASSPLHRTARTAPRSFWRNLRAWELMLFFGIGTGAYTLVLAWLPPFYTGLGWEPSAAGFLLGGLTLAEVMAGLAVSAWIGRFPDRRKPLGAVLTILICGLTCLILAPLKLALLACLLLGIGIGALFPLSLIVAMDHLDDPAQAGMLAAFVQGGGYLIASFMPLLAGILRDRFSSLTEAWIVMLGGAVMLLALALRFSPASYRRIDA
ncbi:putative transporter YycB [Achromobacter animicus]|uniref:Putative transporter YycB n=1 Tax=Achromobacter animicus TaxID=1389935 RepID=A0A6S7C1Z4_9BURK|nr:MFS transporter [Achromobacter animicus]CAB3736423.1 putative transporter YycB [Achromobacter animicus]